MERDPMMQDDLCMLSHSVHSCARAQVVVSTYTADAQHS